MTENQCGSASFCQAARVWMKQSVVEFWRNEAVKDGTQASAIDAMLAIFLDYEMT
jgi:hypothetical protein